MVSPTDRPADRPLSVTLPDFLWFIHAALDDMVDILRELGDELANRRPPLAGANSAYVIVTHCLGVMEYWGGATVAGRTIARDRAAEFVAHGGVEELVARVTEAGRKLEDDLSGMVSADVPANVHRSDDHAVPYTESKGAVLLHILEELFQHLGQMELTRDVILAADGP